MISGFNNQATRAFVLAQQAARIRSKGRLGTEHLLHGIIQLGEGAAIDALTAAGADIAWIRTETQNRVPDEGGEPAVNILLTPRAENVLTRHCAEAARELGHNVVGPEHLLLGILREESSTGALLLQSCGMSLPALKQSVRAHGGSTSDVSALSRGTSSSLQRNLVMAFIDEVRVNPLLNLGSRTATALYFCLQGFNEGMNRAGRIDSVYENFRQWLCQRIQSANGNWAQALIVGGCTDEAAMEHFFTMLDEYRGAQGRAI